MFQNFAPTFSNSEMDSPFFLNTVRMIKVMGKTTRSKAVKSLNDYIWSLQGKCDSITEINRQLISQYCRFIVLCEEISLELIGEPTQAQIDDLTKNYEKFNKIALNLYKTLKFDAIKDELANYNNPLEELLKEEENDGDF